MPDTKLAHGKKPRAFEKKGKKMSKNRGGRREEVDLAKMKEGLPPGPSPTSAVRKFTFRPVATIIPQRDEAADQQFAENKVAVEAGIRDYVAELRRLQEAVTTSPDNFALIAQLEAIEGAIKDVFNRASQPAEGGSRALGLVAILAFAQNLVATCWTEKLWVIDATRRLTATGFMAQCEEGKKGVEILGRDYRLCEDFQKVPAAQKALRDLQAIGVTAGQVAREDFESALAEMNKLEAECPLSVAELKSGKSGRIVLYLPQKEKEDETGKTRHFAGGHLLLESDGTIIRLISVIGSASKFAEELISGGTTVKVSHLGQQPPSTLPSQVQKLSYWLRDSITHAEEEEAKTADDAKWQAVEAKEVAELTSKATSLISAENFLLRQMSGQLIVRFGSDRTFDQKSKGKDGKEVTIHFHALSALIERRVDGAIRLVACPERLKPLFAGCADFAQPEQNFKGLCTPLGVCLRAEFGRAQKAALETAAKKASADVATPAVKAEAAATAAAMLAVREQAQAVKEEQPAPAPSAAPAPEPAQPAPAPEPPVASEPSAAPAITDDEVWEAMIAAGEPAEKRAQLEKALRLQAEGTKLKPSAVAEVERLMALISVTRERLIAEAVAATAEEDPFA